MDNVSVEVHNGSGDFIKVKEEAMDEDVVMDDDPEDPLVTSDHDDLTTNAYEKFESDRISLFLIKSEESSSETPSIHSICPECGSLEPILKLGRHLLDEHKSWTFDCPGEKCQKLGKDMSAHIEQFHLEVLCTVCDRTFDLRKHRQHLKECHLKKSFKTDICIDSGNDSSLPEPLVETNEDVEDSEQRSESQTSALEDHTGYLLEGDIVVVDGIEYLIRDYHIFVDCPLCDKAMGLSVLGAHLEQDHMKLRFECFAHKCNFRISNADIQQHYLKRHGGLNCARCKTYLTILEVKNHMASKCSQKITSEPDQGKTISVPKPPTPPASRKIVPILPKPASLVAVPIGDVGQPKVPTVPCPYCQKQCSYLNKHIRDVHQPKINCEICGKRMGQSYMREHMQIQHQGKEVPTMECPLCNVNVQKVKNHFKYSHKMNKKDADELYNLHFGRKSKK